VLRRVLESELDSSVVIVQVGFSTNLARCSIRREARAGRAKSESPGFDGRRFRRPWTRVQRQDRYSLRAETRRRVARPGLLERVRVGSTIKYPARSIERDFGPPGANPVADAYRNTHHAL